MMKLLWRTVVLEALLGRPARESEVEVRLEAEEGDEVDGLETGPARNHCGSRKYVCEQPQVAEGSGNGETHPE